MGRMRIGFALAIAAGLALACANPPRDPAAPPAPEVPSPPSDGGEVDRAEKERVWRENFAETQRSFCAALTEHAKLYEEAPNDLKRSAVRGARGKALRAAVPRGRVEGWMAEIKTLTTTSQGNAVLEMHLYCLDTKAVGIGTWNNEISDVADQTLIRSESPDYAFLSNMSPGQLLTFNGSLIPDDRDGFKEISLTERGSMLEGYFLLRLEGR